MDSNNDKERLRIVNDDDERVQLDSYREGTTGDVGVSVSSTPGRTTFENPRDNDNEDNVNLVGSSGFTSKSASVTLPTHHSSTRNSKPNSYSLSSWPSIRPFRGIIQDIRSRAPYYPSDWTDAWNYRVVPATLLIFFANVLPGIAFSLDLIETTDQYGVAEVLLSSFMAAFVFSVFGAQPLCIAGVTGPITVLNKTIYDILKDREDAPNYLHFIGWVYMWGAILHWITAALNWCNFLKYVTRFSCDTFGFYVSWVYLQYGIQVLTRQLPNSISTSNNTLTLTIDGAYVQIILALLMLVTSFLFQFAARSSLFHRHVRRFFDDYGMPIALVATSGMAYWGRFNHSNPTTLPVGGAFEPAGGREWLVRFWLLPAKWVGIAFPFGFVLWVLFFFDHNVSSLIAQGSEFPLRKPPGFHYDFFLLGITTFIAGLLGVPAPNGLIPQAPIHTASLVVMGRREKVDEETDVKGNGARSSTGSGTGMDGVGVSCEKKGVDIGGESTIERNIFNTRVEGDVLEVTREVPVAVVEQRVSNLAQGTMCLVLLTGPFLHVLNRIPKGVLAGLFWFMGADALQSNGITMKILYLLRDRTLTSPRDPLRKVRPSRLVLFVLVQLVGFGATFAITQTRGAIGFPVIIMLLVPLRKSVIPMMPFTAEELALLDGPTASPFTMESVGGTL